MSALGPGHCSVLSYPESSFFPTNNFYIQVKTYRVLEENLVHLL